MILKKAAIHFLTLADGQHFDVFQFRLFSSTGNTKMLTNIFNNDVVSKVGFPQCLELPLLESQVANYGFLKSFHIFSMIAQVKG